MHEAFLCWHMAFSLLLEWRARLDPVATLKLIVDIGVGALTKAERADLLKDLRKNWPNRKAQSRSRCSKRRGDGSVSSGCRARPRRLHDRGELAGDGRE
jgi:hypothetical protein